MSRTAPLIFAEGGRGGHFFTVTFLKALGSLRSTLHGGTNSFYKVLSNTVQHVKRIKEGHDMTEESFVPSVVLVEIC